MRIAVSYDKNTGEVFPHFGQTAFFKLYNAENGAVVSSMLIAAPEQGHGALSEFLSQLRVNVLVCGGLGGGARAALETVGVIPYADVAGEADTAVKAFLAGTLGYDPNFRCRHDHADADCGDCHAHGQDCGGCGHGFRS